MPVGLEIALVKFYETYFCRFWDKLSGNIHKNVCRKICLWQECIFAENRSHYKCLAECMLKVTRGVVISVVRQLLSGKILFKVNNKDSSKVSIDTSLMSLLLILNRCLPKELLVYFPYRLIQRDKILKQIIYFQKNLSCFF